MGGLCHCFNHIIFVYIYISIYLSFYLSIYLSIYIYIYPILLSHNISIYINLQYVYLQYIYLQYIYLQYIYLPQAYRFVIPMSGEHRYTTSRKIPDSNGLGTARWGPPRVCTRMGGSYRSYHGPVQCCHYRPYT